MGRLEVREVTYAQILMSFMCGEKGFEIRFSWRLSARQNLLQRILRRLSASIAVRALNGYGTASSPISSIEMDRSYHRC